jgi:hypothetical protein
VSVNFLAIIASNFPVDFALNQTPPPSVSFIASRLVRLTLIIEHIKMMAGQSRVMNNQTRLLEDIRDLLKETPPTWNGKIRDQLLNIHKGTILCLNSTAF